MKYAVAIGLEVHVQLKTKSKMFCGCETSFGDVPNTHVCPVCLGYPGAMPVMNGEAIRYTVMAGLMIGSKISGYSKFDRKSYFYPDMPKNYQITQYDKPLCIGGAVEIDAANGRRAIHITRIHLEEDVAKNMHFANSSGIDFNRAGIPLMEIVTEPEIESPDEAMKFLLELKRIMEYAGVSNCNLEEGNVRCDVNCSIRPAGSDVLGTKAELKNLNTFKGVYHALEYEIHRQVELVDHGGRILQETRRWDPDTGVTHSMRSKEEAHDYRYFPEPDLLPVILPPDVVAEWKSRLPELPHQRIERFISQYGLPPYDAGVLAADKGVADYFESAARHCSSFKGLSNWIMTEVLRHLSETGKQIGDICVPPPALAELVGMVDAGAVNNTVAKEVLNAMFEDGGSPADIVRAKGLSQVSDEDSLSELVESAIAANAKSVEAYRGGKAAALQSLVGHVMKASRGKANAAKVQDILRRKLG
ncbi:MAG: Asp-tRNA(Asn)/Glu-tRNA(Gln) amidotransferase subunit GatB [bacterium]